MKKVTPIRSINKVRIVRGFFLVMICLVALLANLGRIQIIQADELSQRATSQQTSDATINPQRGNIYDRNGKELATTITCYTLWARPAILVKNDGLIKSSSEIYAIAASIAEITGDEVEDVKNIITQDQAMVKVAKYLTNEQKNKIAELKLDGLETQKDTRRFYPLGNFASQVLGSVTDDNSGRTGLELEYNTELTGTPGRSVKVKDLLGYELVGGSKKYYEKEDGVNLITTIDEAIQFYCENAIADCRETTGAEKVMCLVMDPNNGDILACATNPGFDPNEPYKIDDEVKEDEYSTLETGQEKSNFFSKMWRNPIVSDTYEPGSTFKLVTASAAIEEKAVSLTETFSCHVFFKVADYTLKCWSAVPHGTETLKVAVGNSCNPALAAVAKKLGASKFRKYLDLFGISEKTGVDYPGEASAIIQDTIGPVELATMGYGQGISLTPLQLLTAANAIANGGTIYEPRFVSAFTDSYGKTIETVEPKVVRQAISEKTAAEMREIMEYVVSDGGGTNAYIEGYRIGGKTGTANKVEEDGAYGDYYYSSFLGIAPINDPKFSILVVVDSPKTSRYGSLVAAPVAREIMENILRYMNIEPDYGDSEKGSKASGLVKVPDVTGMKFSTAKQYIKNSGLKVHRSDEAKESDDWIVVDQFPKGGEKVEKKSTVELYKE